MGEREVNISVQVPMFPHLKAKALQSRREMLSGCSWSGQGGYPDVVSGCVFPSTICCWSAVK